MIYTLYDPQKRLVDIKQCQLAPLANRPLLYRHFSKKSPHSCLPTRPTFEKVYIKLNNQSENSLIHVINEKGLNPTE